MPRLHTVGDGEHLSGIAERYDFENFETIWNRDENEPLRDARAMPDVLLPGDTVFVPDKKTKQFARPTGAMHRFQVKLHAIKLTVYLQDLGSDPVSGQDCSLSVGGVTQTATSDGDGKIEVKIPRAVGSGVLTIGDRSIDFDVGLLDPIDSERGWKQRLVNLGYVSVAPEDMDARFERCAIEELQYDYELPQTGVLDDATRDALLAAHGS
jgi:hypothetical protein